MLGRGPAVWCNLVAKLIVLAFAAPFMNEATSAEPVDIHSAAMIPGQGHAPDKWTPDDLLSGREDVLRPLRERIDTGELRRDPRLHDRGVGTVDIGEIAVIADDGTLVNPVTNVTDIIAIANAFLATHTDEYDELITFVASTFPGDVEPEAGFAFFLRVAGFTAGVNVTQGNPNETGGITRLFGLVNMNDLPEYPADFRTDFFGSGAASGAEILGQEFAHAFGAFVQPDDRFDILGRGNSHWSFFLHHPGEGNASPMEGNRWQDNGDGTYTTVESFSGFSELDEYLMGLRAPEDVGPFFLITPPAFSDATFPTSGVTVEGIRNDLTIRNIINDNGPRMPDTTTSMKTFKVAFILVIPQGTTADSADLAKIGGFRQDWVTYFESATEGLGAMDTTLAPAPITTLPFADDFNGATPDISNWTYVQGAAISELGLGEPSGGRSLELNGNWGGGDEVRSRVIDLTGFAPGDVTVNYSVERTGGGDSPEPFEDLLVEYFNNQGNWALLRSFGGNGPNQVNFSAFEDVLPNEGLHSGFRLRFHHLQGTIGDSDHYFVDDVSIIFPPVPGDCDGDARAGLGDFVGFFAPCLLGPDAGLGDSCECIDFDGDDDVDLSDFASFEVVLAN